MTLLFNTMYFDALFWRHFILSDVISLIGPKILDVDTIN